MTILAWVLGVVLLSLPWFKTGRVPKAKGTIRLEEWPSLPELQSGKVLNYRVIRVG